MRVYTATYNQVATSSAGTLIDIQASANETLILLRGWVTQDDSETSEQLPILIQRSCGDGAGTAITPRSHETGDSTFGGTAIAPATCQPTLAGDPLINESFNVLNGWVYVPMPEERIFVAPSSNIALRLDADPDAQLKLSAALVFGSLG